VNQHFHIVGRDTDRVFALCHGTDLTVKRSDHEFICRLDAYAFAERAKKYELLLVPGDDFAAPGYVRISYCVGTEQIRRSLPAFAALAKEYGLN
jgi:hypothetical protein